MKIITTCLAVLIAFTLICCDDSDETVSLEWVASDLSKYGSSFSTFSVGDDGKLYAIGYVYSDENISEGGVYRALNNHDWQKIMILDNSQFFAPRFTIFKNKVYFIRYEDTGLPYLTPSLWKGSGTFLEKVTTSNVIKDVIPFKGQLIVMGDIANAVISTYDGDSFTEIPGPNEPSWGGSHLLFQAHELLYLRDNFGTYQFDGTSLKKIQTDGNIKTVDAQGNFYSVSYNEGRDNILKNGEIVGNEFDSGISIYDLFLNKQKLIATGQNHNTGLSVTYHLDQNVWKPVPTTNNFSEVFEFDNRIFAYDGAMIAELVIR